jgi:hypothetical protein
VLFEALAGDPRCRKAVSNSCAPINSLAIGACAASYFRTWVGTPIKWRGTSRRLILANWHFIRQRSSPYHLAGNRNAAHPVNALLNYAYAALESEIRIKAISDGYDPTIGIMHEGSDGSSNGAQASLALGSRLLAKQGGLACANTRKSSEQSV